MTSTRDPIQMLIDDHNKVRRLFQDFESAADPRERRTVADQLMSELEVHATIEEEIFYPAFRQQGDSKDKELVAEAVEEHAGVKELIQTLRSMPAEDSGFEMLFRRLQEEVEHHASEEEQEMLPKAREELGGRLDQIGQEMMARRERLMQQARALR